eukprot:NODE_2154_length_1189_cov_4.702632_g1786_i0.p3 GENE.NODE_2154_length_1189_cov_4.702632_g1786_i0~~NODE_2154_length_1189_cov_4.702632_g1786_i0.p3  ORF type:complete len:56 (-),score=1.04 NODE_2154_length_1189_cov_4.702632_g1786_i0:67-234(-)
MVWQPSETGLDPSLTAVGPGTQGGVWPALAQGASGLASARPAGEGGHAPLPGIKT